MANYESLTEQYKEGDSNFFYYYLDLKSGKVVTNRESWGRKIILMMLLKVFVRWGNMS